MRNKLQTLSDRFFESYPNSYPKIEWVIDRLEEKLNSIIKRDKALVLISLLHYWKVDGPSSKELIVVGEATSCLILMLSIQLPHCISCSKKRKKLLQNGI